MKVSLFALLAAASLGYAAEQGAQEAQEAQAGQSAQAAQAAQADQAKQGEQGKQAKQYGGLGGIPPGGPIGGPVGGVAPPCTSTSYTRSGNILLTTHHSPGNRPQWRHHPERLGRWRLPSPPSPTTGRIPAHPSSSAPTAAMDPTTSTPTTNSKLPSRLSAVACRLSLRRPGGRPIPERLRKPEQRQHRLRQWRQRWRSDWR